MSVPSHAGAAGALGAGGGGGALGVVCTGAGATCTGWVTGLTTFPEPVVIIGGALTPAFGGVLTTLVTGEPETVEPPLGELILCEFPLLLFTGA